MKEKIRGYLKRYFIDAMGAMALGLFASLLIGTIFNTIGKYTGVELFTDINKLASASAGMAIGVAVACSLKADPLVIFSCATVGYAGYSLGTAIGEINVTAGPAGSFFAVIVAAELANARFKENQGRYSRYSFRDDTRRSTHRKANLPRNRVSYVLPWRFCQYRDTVSAFPHGNCGVRSRRNSPDTSDILCGSLRYDINFGNRGRCGCCRMLLSDGRICGVQLP